MYIQIHPPNQYRKERKGGWGKKKKKAKQKNSIVPYASQPSSSIPSHSVITPPAHYIPKTQESEEEKEKERKRKKGKRMY